MKLLEYNVEYRDKVHNFIYEAMLENPDKNAEDLEDELIDLDSIYSTYVEDGGQFWMMVSKTGEVVGTIALKVFDKEVGSIKRFYVKDLYRRTGLGSELYKTLEGTASKLGLKELIVLAGNKLESAHNFCKKHGFEEEEEEIDSCEKIFSKQLG